VVAAVEHTAFQHERVPLGEEGMSLFRVVSQAPLWGPRSLSQGLNDRLEVIVKRLGLTDIIQ